MRKLKQATQREKACRALKDRKPAEQDRGQIETDETGHWSPLHESIGSATPAGNKHGQRRRGATAQKITHH